jgi:hypothetical protein
VRVALGTAACSDQGLPRMRPGDELPDTRGMLITAIAPDEVFAPWRRAQIEFTRHAREVPPAPDRLRTTGFLPPDLAQRVTDWYLEEAATPTDTVLRAYGALERETARLFDIIRRALGVRVGYLHMSGDP